VNNPFVVGPDSESEQWVSAVAKDADAPYTVLQKVRRGDRDVEISVKNLRDLEGRTPVLVDDIISTGRTMTEAVRLIAKQSGPPPVCVAVHGLFAEHCDSLLAQAGPALSRRTASRMGPTPSTWRKSWRPRSASLR
jgi:ribose-phosphate pyrophosphokinase